MRMGRIATACYRPRPGSDGRLAEVVREHQTVLRAGGFAAGRPPVVMRSEDGTVIEIFEWASREKKEAAHRDPAVLAVWARLEECAEIAALADLAEGTRQFASFDTVALEPD